MKGQSGKQRNGPCRKWSVGYSKALQIMNFIQATK